jgi:hypothetical protein
MSGGGMEWNARELVPALHRVGRRCLSLPCACRCGPFPTQLEGAMRFVEGSLKILPGIVEQTFFDAPSIIDCINNSSPSWSRILVNPPSRDATGGVCLSFIQICSPLLLRLPVYDICLLSVPLTRLKARQDSLPCGLGRVLVGTAMPCHLEARQTFLFLSVRGVCSVINRVSDALSFRGQQRFDRLTDVPGNTCGTWTWPWLRYRNRSRNVQAPQPSQQWADKVPAREREKTLN